MYGSRVTRSPSIQCLQGGAPVGFAPRVEFVEPVYLAQARPDLVEVPALEAAQMPGSRKYPAPHQPPHLGPGEAEHSGHAVFVQEKRPHPESLYGRHGAFHGPRAFSVACPSA